MKWTLAAGLLFCCVPLVEAGSKQGAPADIATQFYQMANQGKCSEAERLFTAESLQAISAAMGSTDGFLRFCTDRGGKAAIESLSVKSAERSGNHAQVMIERSYKDGSLAIERDDLVKVGGEWKLLVGGSPARR